MTSHLPSVTALCPTYGRTSLLEESIESFLRQDYQGEKQLVVLNDLAEQTLVLPNCPDCITIVNLDKRLPNLGAKRNVTAAFAKTELIMTWSDDDIHLPSRISSNVAAYDERLYVHEPAPSFLYIAPVMSMSQELCGPMLMSRSDYWRIGGIPELENGEDVAFREVVARSGLTFRKSGTPSYVYRWGGNRYHTSGHKENSGAWEKIRIQVESTIKSGAEPSGIIHLKPHWKEDYVERARAALAESLAA